MIVLFVICFGIVVVKAATKDTTPPVLKSISLKETNKTFNVGDEVYLNIDANDDVSGIANLYVNVENVSSDAEVTSSCSGFQDVYDFISNPYFVIPSCLGNGKYKINYLVLSDNAGNVSSYTSDKSNQSMKYISFNAEFLVKTDRNTVVPSLKSIKTDKTSYKKGEYVNITISLDGDYSNVERLYATFLNKSKDSYFYVDTFYGDLIYNESKGVFEASIEVPSYNGEYVLQDVYIGDKVSNERWYNIDRTQTKEAGPEYTSYYVEPIKFSVSGGFDTTPEVKISKIDYTYKKLVAPNIYKIGLKLEDPANIVQGVKILLRMKNNPSRCIEAYLYKGEDGNLSGYIDINQFNDVGVYYLDEINLNPFYSRDEVLNQISSNLKFNKVELFEIIEDNTYDVITSTTDKELIEKIKNVKDDAKIAINSTSASVVSEEVFRAIKGTNKIIYIEAGGIQWIFNGSDIETIKDVDTSVEFNYLYDDDLNISMNNILEKALIVRFAENGELPGKALVRVKTDYALRDYLGYDNLFVYHYLNTKDKKFNRVANSISMTEDGFLEFYINHNSTFVITNNEVDSKYLTKSVKELALNDNSVKVSDDGNNSDKDADKTNLIISLVGIAIFAIVLFAVTRKKKKNDKEA